MWILCDGAEYTMRNWQIKESKEHTLVLGTSLDSNQAKDGLPADTRFHAAPSAKYGQYFCSDSGLTTDAQRC
jgi:hypothetical protein